MTVLKLHLFRNSEKFHEELNQRKDLSVTDKKRAFNPEKGQNKIEFAVSIYIPGKKLPFEF